MTDEARLQFTHLPRTLALAALLLVAAGCSDDSPSGPPPNVFPGEPAVITEGPATLSIPAGDHLVLEQKGSSPFRVDVEVGRDDAEVALDEGESLVSELVTISHDQAGPLPVLSSDDNDPFARLTLAFDPALLPEGEIPDDLNIIVVAGYPAESEGTGGPVHDEMATARALGDIDTEAGTIEVAISLLPQRMDVGVVYSPDLVSLSETIDPVDPIWVTPTPPFSCCAVYVVYPEAPADRDCTLPEYDDNSACRFRRLAEQMEGTGDAAAIARVVRQRVMVPTFRAMRSYLNLGFRQPKLEFRAIAGEEVSEAVMHAGWGVSRYILSAPFPQINIGMTVIESDANPLVGTVQGHIFHEMMHAIVEGYDIGKIRVGNVRSLRGFNEGLAMVFENTQGADVTIAGVRSGKDYAIYRLDMPLGSYERPYANDDFFAYLLRRYLNNDFGFIAGDEGLLELMAAYSAQVGLTTGEDYRRAYLRALDDAIRTATASAANLHDVFDGFVRNRFYEHDDASRLRSGDTQPVNTAVPDLFSTTDNRVTVTVTDGRVINVPGNEAPIWALRDGLAPLSAALVILEAGSDSHGFRYQGEVRLDFDAQGVVLGEEGLRITRYREGEGGISLVGNAFVDRFTSSTSKLYVLIVNTSLEGAADLAIRVSTADDELDPQPDAGDATVETVWFPCPATFPTREEGTWPLAHEWELWNNPPYFQYQCRYSKPEGAHPWLDEVRGFTIWWCTAADDSYPGCGVVPPNPGSEDVASDTHKAYVSTGDTYYDPPLFGEDVWAFVDTLLGIIENGHDATGQNPVLPAGAWRCP